MNNFLNQMLVKAAADLRSVGVEASNYELRLLLAAAMGAEESTLLFADRLPTSEQQAAFAHMLEQRKQHMPIDKILGHRGFYKYDFKVDCHVLSPRPDTEVLVEAALGFARAACPGQMLELGVGSGCVIASLLAELPDWRGVGVDVSAQALQIAAANAQTLGVDNRLRLVRASWFESDFAAALGQKFALIVSNPPYIPSAEIATLEPDVKDYDPRLALDGGADGLDSYRRIAELAPELLSAGGTICLEVGEGQAEAVADLFLAQGLVLAAVLEDLSGIKRCVCLKK